MGLGAGQNTQQSAFLGGFGSNTQPMFGSQPAFGAPGGTQQNTFGQGTSMFSSQSMSMPMPMPAQGAQPALSMLAARK
jgi:hypothetical protein